MYLSGNPDFFQLRNNFCKLHSLGSSGEISGNTNRLQVIKKKKTEKRYKNKEMKVIEIPTWHKFSISNDRTRYKQIGSDDPYLNH